MDALREEDLPTLQPLLEPVPPPASLNKLVSLDLKNGLTILVNDPQRHTDSGHVLMDLIGHVDLASVRILVATGTHVFSPAEKRAHEANLTAALGNVEMAWHDCRSESLVPIGSGPGAWYGHPWLLDNRTILAIGSVEPHYFAGFTGAHKTATIGCASYEDIEANHAGALDPASGPCVLGGNPVFEGHRRMLRTLQRQQGWMIHAVNLVQAGATILAEGRGDPLQALGGVRDAAERSFVRRIPVQADALELHVSGPLSRSFYQADKAIKNSQHAVRDGGVIVLVSGCEDGMGQDRFVSLLRQAPTAAAAREIVADRGYRLGDHKAVGLRHLTDPAARGVRVYAVCPGLRDEEISLLGFSRAHSAQDAYAASGVDRQRDKGYRVLDAGNVCVVAADTAKDARPGDAPI